MPKAVDITDQKFTRLTACKPVGSVKGEGVLWECKCDCGAAVRTPAKRLLNGNTKSCGCLSRDSIKERNRKSALHGMTNTPTFISWDNMKQRCENPNHKSYANYGGVGVTVCERWHEFLAFLADMGERPAGTTLDRIDNNKGYQPGNCRWITPLEQGNNRRNNIKLTLHGVTDTLGNWSRKTGIGQKTIMYRMKNGWTDEQALTVIPSKSNKLEKL